MSEKEKIPQDTDPVAPDAPEEPVEDTERLLDRLMRLQAEYENYRKRITREKAVWTAQAIESLLFDLLQVMDSFNLAFASAADAQDVSAVLEGMRLVEKQLAGALRARGVVPIEALGEAFDPNLHEAFMSRPATADETPGTIVEEFMKGYTIRDRTLRPTKGIVAAAPDDTGSSSSSAEE